MTNNTISEVASQAFKQIDWSPKATEITIVNNSLDKLEDNALGFLHSDEESNSSLLKMSGNYISNNCQCDMLSKIDKDLTMIHDHVKVKAGSFLASFIGSLQCRFSSDGKKVDWPGFDRLKCSDLHDHPHEEGKNSSTCWSSSWSSSNAKSAKKRKIAPFSAIL